MKGYRYILLSIILLAVSPKISALTCDNKVKVDYQEKAKNITYSYDYNDSNNTFNATITNIAEGFYLLDLDSYQRHGYSGSELTLNNLQPGRRYKFGIYSSNIDCLNKNLYTLYVTLPYYNPYYKDSLCSGIENYKYCKKFINKSVTYEEFAQNVTDYRNKLINGDDEEDKKDAISSLLSEIFNFYLKYYYIFSLVIIIGGGIIIWRHNKKQDLF